MIATLGPLTAEQVYSAVDPDKLGFSTTDDVKPVKDGISQARAIESLQFGTAIEHDGYNLFAFGEPGSGRHTLIGNYLRQRALERPAPSDWCYVNNFSDSQKPEALALPSGTAKLFAEDLEKFVEDLRVAITAAFDSEDYRERRQSIEAEINERQETELQALHEQATKSSAALVRTPMGFAIAPVADGKVIEPDVFHALPEKEQERIRENVSGLEKKLEEIVRHIPGWHKELAEKVHELNREVTAFSATHLIDELKKKYEHLPEILDWLERVRNDIIDNAEVFWRAVTEVEATPMAVEFAESPYERYRVNLLVDNSALSQAPVIVADHPTFPKLFGRVEHQSRFGNLVTDYRMIRAGALHEANGGYLIVDARDLLVQPLAWEMLKRVLKNKYLDIESLGEAMGYSGLTTLEPEPIPLDVKVVLIADRRLYYLLSAFDPDIDKLFKVSVDFDDVAERSAKSERRFAGVIAGLVTHKNLLPMDASAVARLIEHASRVAADSRRLSLHTALLQDIAVEADHYARAGRKSVSSRIHVDQALRARRRQRDRVYQRSLEHIERDIQLIETKGEAVGQINGLSVISLGDFTFGKPSRITANIRLGRGEVIDIERQVELGGPLHSKGVLILSAFLGEKFGQTRPLALNASLVFEQSYGGVDGDSASAAELLVLLSALSGQPVKQRFAITGSVNQKGQIQAIGGVNQKIEGFFDACKRRGLRGRPGVVIPKSNVQHLMLREDVVQAVRKGSFVIYSIDCIEDGVELMLGAPAGVPAADGEYPIGSVYRRVVEKLDEFGALARKQAHQAEKNEETAG